MRFKFDKAIFFGLVAAFGLATAAHGQTKWVATWATSPQDDSDDTAVKPEELRGGTLRQIVHLSLGGAQLRLHLSNRYETGAVHFTSVHVAKAVGAGSAKIVAGSDKE